VLAVTAAAAAVVTAVVVVVMVMVVIVAVLMIMAVVMIVVMMIVMHSKISFGFNRFSSIINAGKPNVKTFIFPKLSPTRACAKGQKGV
jgi:hypothetical protein